MSRRIAVSCLLIAIIGFAIFIYIVPPAGQTFWPKCLLVQTTGLYCPGCGGTRSVHLLLHGDVLGAISQNLLFIFIGLPLSIWFYIAGARYVLTGTWSHPQLKGTKATAAAVILVVGFGLIRNIPFEPFTFLAPKDLNANAKRK
ncbi:MAG: DUF2752 domain-containing protein [Fimbriimonadales bacterium]|nr:DUF2752 domain-containing protein [Fimbriimonadales bacterium]